MQNLEIVDSQKPDGFFKLFIKELKHDKLAIICAVLLIFIILFIYIAAPIINSQMNIMQANLANQNRSPEQSGSLLGTDDTGRYIAPFLVLAARNSLNIAFSVTFFAFIIGVLIGLFSGFYGGTFDNIVMRIVDTWTMIPFLMVIIAVMSIVGERTPPLFIFILTLFGWMGRARLIRAAALQQKNLDYIQGSKTLGTPNIIIIFREMFPNLLDIIVANFVITMAASIGIETGITIIGFGLGVEHATLGTLISNSLHPVNLQFRWWTWLPAFILVVTIMLCINFIGNVLQRAADPKQRLQ
ncbi:MAG: ABC transporter permease [Defluviitaleaceae bacterium]|nr:ABC transporter permease [Defluviitaleaceae bacterium]